MNDHSRPHRFLWLVGIALLIGTALGAGWALNSSLVGDGYAGTGTDPDSSPLPPSFVALGFVDVEPGIVKLYPMQQGRVIFVAAEGTLVKKGDVLLSLEKQLAEYNVREATAAKKNAENLLAKANNGLKKHAIDVKKQKKAIAIAEHKWKALRHDLDRKKSVEKLLNEHELGMLEEGVKALENLVDVEKLNLNALELAAPDIEIDRARQDVEAKKAQLDKASLALKECDLLAPADGAVLRVFVNPSEVLDSNPKAPAIQFCPNTKRIIRAEVLQEWASGVAKDQRVTIEDDSQAGPRWTGKIKHVSDWFTHKRNVIIEPLMKNDVRTLECLIDVNPGGPPLRIGQRVRVIIQQEPAKPGD